MLAVGLSPATLELHTGANHPAVRGPVPVSVGASHADQAAHLEGLLSLHKVDCSACVLRSRDQSLDLAIPAATGGPEPGALVPETRGSLSSLSVYRLGPSRAPPRS